MCLRFGASRKSNNFGKCHPVSFLPLFSCLSCCPLRVLVFNYLVNKEVDDRGNYTLISNASCTANQKFRVLKLLGETFGIEYGTMTTIHSYNGDRMNLDGRVGAMNIVPNIIGITGAFVLMLPQLRGELNGIAPRVPTRNVGIFNFVAKTFTKTDEHAHMKDDSSSQPRHRPCLAAGHDASSGHVAKERNYGNQTFSIRNNSWFLGRYSRWAPSNLLVGKLQNHPGVCLLVLSSRCSYSLCLYLHPSFCCSCVHGSAQHVAYSESRMHGCAPKIARYLGSLISPFSCFIFS